MNWEDLTVSVSFVVGLLIGVVLTARLVKAVAGILTDIQKKKDED